MHSTSRIRCSLAIAAAFACSACPVKIAPPSAVISSDASSAAGDAGACSEVTTLATRVGVAPVLHAACSSDPNDLRLTYHWSIVDQPNGADPRIVDASVASPTFLTNEPGSYRLSLIVSNGTLTSEPAFVTLEVGECGARAPEVRTISRSPAGAIAVGSLVVLTPRVDDADEEPPCSAQSPDDFTFKWTFVNLPPGSSARFNATTAEAPSLWPDVAGTYTARVEVTDAAGRSSTHTIRFEVAP